jgi:type IV pilus biogenesis protein CpaD/CtpE
MRLYEHLQPIVKAALSTALSKIHISFDRWTTKGGKRGFLGVVAHYVNSDSKVVDLPIALPQLTGAHSREKVAEIVSKLLQQFSIDQHMISYFILNNASNNDTAVLALARIMGFSATYRRLCCGPYTLNLAGQTLLWGNNGDAFDNDVSNLDVS